jgi:prevent-host-death family protein
MHMKTVGTFEGKTHFSALIDAASRGESTIVTRKGVPVAKIVPIHADRMSAAREALDRILSRDVRVGVPSQELLAEGRRH